MASPTFGPASLYVKSFAVISMLPLTFTVSATGLVPAASNRRTSPIPAPLVCDVMRLKVF